jgi:hypothetical protein
MAGTALKVRQKCSLTLGGLLASHYGDVCKANNLHGRSTLLNLVNARNNAGAKAQADFLGIRAQNGNPNGATLITAIPDENYARR